MKYSVTKKIVVLGTALSLVFSAHSASAQAPVPVAEVGLSLITQKATLFESGVSALKESAQVTKDWILDDLAYQVGNLAIKSMTKSIVNWINSGFQGSPAFVTDLNTNLRGVGDAVANYFFEELSNQTIVTTPFQDKVLNAVRLGYYLRTSPESFYTRYPYTLNQVSANDRAFLEGDFSQGGFNAWFATVMNPNNNMFGAQMLAEQALGDAVSSATNNRLQELNWNRGFLSWRGECLAAAKPEAVSLAGTDPCLKYEIKTPGSVIMESLNKVEGIPFDRLVSADEFNEVIGALLNQLALQVLGGGDSGGVRGLSQPSTSGQTFFDRTEAVDAASGARLASNFAGTVTEQRQRLGSYQTGWERIRTAAQAAEQRCGDNTEVRAALTRANAALVKAADATTVLTTLETDIGATAGGGGDEVLSVSEVITRYTDLSSSNTLPSAEEMAEAQLESTDTGDTEPGSLYSRMMRLSRSGSCNSSE